MRKVLIFLVSLMTSLPTIIMSQQLNLENSNLLEALKKIDELTDWSINYDSESVQKIKIPYSKQIDLKNQKKSLNALLDGTNIDFEILNGVVILLPTNKKEYAICGKLLDSDSRLPLPFAHVYIDNLNAALTDELGNFNFSIRAFKDEKIRISYLGYEEKIIFAGVFKEDCQEIILNQDAVIFGKEVIIRDYIFSSVSQGKDYNSVNFDMNALNHELGALEKDVYKSVQFLPGVTSLDETASNISIRGSEPDHNLLLWEDVPLYSSGHFFGMISSVNPFVVDKLTVYNDVYSSSFDNRIGGVVDIKLLNRIPDKLKIGLGTTFTEAHTEISLPLFDNKLGVIISGRRSLNNTFENNLTSKSYGEKIFQSSEIPIGEEEENVSESDVHLKFHDINAKVIFNPNDRIKFTSAYLNSNDNFLHEYEFQLDQFGGFDSLDIETQIFTNGLQYNWSKESHSFIKLNHSSYSSEYVFLFNELDDPESDFFRLNKNEISDTQLKLLHEYHWTNVKVEGGYTFDHKNLEYEIEEFGQYEADNEIEEERSGNFHHLFSDIKWKSGKWILDIGGRLTFLKENKNLVFSPRLSINHLMNEHLTFRMSTGLFNQYINQIVNISQSDLNIENRIWTLSENPMKSTKFSVGGIFKKNGWLIDLDLYNHYSTSVPVLTSGQGSALEINLNGSSNAQGLELLIKKRINNLSSGISYHLGYVDYILSDIDGDDFPGNVDQRHNLSLITHYKSKGFHISLLYSLKSGLPYSDIEGIQFVEEVDEDYYEIELTGINDQRLPLLKRLDATFGYKTSISEHVNIDLQFSLYNILNTNNALSRNYFLSNTEQMTAEPEILEIEKFQLGRTPQMLIRLNF